MAPLREMTTNLGLRPGSGISQLSVTWVGHATVLLEIDGARVLTDPVLRNRVGPLVRLGRPADPHVADRLDAVLLSHLHADHADLPSLRRAHAPIVAPRGAGRWLSRQGLADVHELGAGDEITVGGLRVRATQAAHGRTRRPLGPRAEPIGFVLGGSRSCYFAGDTDLFPGMADLPGPIDLALLPVAGWGPTLGPGHLDPARAAEAARMIMPAVAVPIHWGTFALAAPMSRPADPELPAREFAELVAGGSPAVEVRILSPGETTVVR